ncbi:hypothetical protein ACGFIV_00845 [Sphaerisporangium sp. NPDC049003]|uniref:hypothetical protein n=1 Tax=Sphaerisporangium sp. NPDC049003 TaxID=3364517 RepID=UPI00371B47BF
MTPARPLPPPPPEGAAEDCFNDEAPSVGWRWYRALGTWERVCVAHSGGSKPFRTGDYVPDWARVERTLKESDHG